MEKDSERRRIQDREVFKTKKDLGWRMEKDLGRRSFQDGEGFRTE